MDFPYMYMYLAKPDDFIDVILYNYDFLNQAIKLNVYLYITLTYKIEICKMLFVGKILFQKHLPYIYKNIHIRFYTVIHYNAIAVC